MATSWDEHIYLHEYVDGKALYPEASIFSTSAL